MSVTLVINESIAIELELAAMAPTETAAVLLVSVLSTAAGATRLLAREIHWVKEEAYVERAYDGMSIRSQGYVHALSRAEQIRSSAIWVHTHPGLKSIPLPSVRDTVVDEHLADLFRLRTGSDYYGALIVSARPTAFGFSGHLQVRDGPALPIDRIWRVGSRLSLIMPHGSQGVDFSLAFDRNILAFGPEAQSALGHLHVGIVGCGGTGSAVAEQLARLGVREFTLVDPETLSSSNVTRVYGSTCADVGRFKVDVVGDHLSRIASELHAQRVRGKVVMERVARRLLDCDLVFGCTDDNAGRLVLSRVASYLMVPVIDCGVVLTSGPGGRLEGIDGRVTVLTPGQACLVCRGRVDLGRAGAELLTPEERARRVDDGYAPALGDVEPSVVAFTTAVAASAVNEFLERLIGYGPDPRPSEILLRMHERELSTNSAVPREGHYCDPAAGKIGLGMTEPFLEQTWPS